jgi:DNA replication initiation complex subunit (GINS family)
MSEIMLQLYEAAQARIAELEAEVVEWQDAHEQQHRAWHEARAEVERLRQVVDDLRKILELKPDAD